MLVLTLEVQGEIVWGCWLYSALCNVPPPSLSSSLDLSWGWRNEIQGPGLASASGITWLEGVKWGSRINLGLTNTSRGACLRAMQWLVLYNGNTFNNLKLIHIIGMGTVILNPTGPNNEGGVGLDLSVWQMINLASLANLTRLTFMFYVSTLYIQNFKFWNYRNCRVQKYSALYNKTKIIKPAKSSRPQAC